MQKIRTQTDKGGPDFILMGILGSLVLIGFLVLSAASIPYSLRITGDPNYFLFKQLISGLIGLIAGFIAYKLPLEKVKKISIFFFFVAVVLMFAVFIPALGHGTKGATRWIDIGFASFQPSELLKITSIIYLATIASKVKKSFPWPFLIVMGIISSSLLLQRDLSTLIIICAIAGVIYFCSHAPLKNVFLIALTAIILLGASVFIEPYRMQRVENILNPSKDSLGAGYHPQQALISIGSGGLTGSGLGLSVQKFGFLPESISDSIFAIYAEETGFIGCVFLVGLFLFFAFRAFLIAKKTENLPDKLIACAIGFWITLQAFINMASMSGIIPVSGVPLPFISSGGSHLMVELTAMGILLNISKKA